MTAFTNPESYPKRGKLVVLDGKHSSTILAFPMNPKSWTDSHSATYADHAIVGRAHPRSFWTSSGSRNIKFKLQLDVRNDSICMTNVGVQFRAVKQEDFNGGAQRNLTVAGGTTGKINRLVAVANFMKSLLRPRIISSGDLQVTSREVMEVLATPPPVLFVWGSYFRIRCIVKSVEIEWLEFDRNLNPIRAEIEVAMAEQPSKLSTYFKYLTKGDTSEPINLNT